MPKSSKVSNTEWGLVIGALACVDGAQVFLDIVFFGWLNPLIDIMVGASLTLYCFLRGVKLDSKKALSILGSFLIELVGTQTLDTLPLWSLDGIALMLLDKADGKLPNLPI